MTPEEEISRAVWFVIRELKKESLVTPEDEYINFWYQSGEQNKLPSEKDQRRAIKKLRKEGAIKVIDTLYRKPFDFLGATTLGIASNGERIDLLEPTFTEIYKHYARVYEPHSLQVKSKDELKSNSIEVSDADPKEISKNLERRYLSFKDLPEKGFFIGLADYVEYIEKTPVLEQIMSLIHAQKARDQEKLNQYEDMLMKDIETTEKTLFDLINEQKISDKGLDYLVDQYNGRKDGRIQSTATKVDGLYTDLSKIIDFLYHNGFQDKVAHLVKIRQEDSVITDYLISKIYEVYKIEYRNFEEQKETSLWGAWNELAVAYLATNKYRTEVEKLSYEFDFWKRMNYYMIRKDIEKMLGKIHDDGHRSFLIKNEFTVHVSRIQNFILDNLSKTKSHKPDAETSIQPVIHTKKVVEKKVDDIYDKDRNDVQDSKRILKWRNLKIDIDQQTIQYGNTSPQEVSLGTNPMKLLILLLEQRKVVQYVEIAKTLNLNSYHEGVTNDDVARDVQGVRRDLVTHLMATVGIKKEEIGQMIVRKTKEGYKIGNE